MTAQAGHPQSLLLLPMLLLLLLHCRLGMAANCTDAAASCVTGSCVPATGKCTCPTSSMIIGDRCDAIKLYDTTANPLTKTANTVLKSLPVAFEAAPWNAGIPLANSEYASSMFICSNGYVTFNRDFCTARIPLLASAVAPAFVAPLATNFDYRNAFATSNISYKLVVSVDADPELKWLRDSVSELSNTTSAIAVTWAAVAPPKAETVGATRHATMQLVIFTDFIKKTKAVMHYASSSTLRDYFTWLPTRVSWKSLTAGEQTLATDRQAAIALTKQRMSVGGVQASIKVQSLYDNATNVNYWKVCREEAQINTPAVSATVLKWCPETLHQAQRDVRFVQISSSSSSSSSLMFNLVPTLVANKTNITCAYDSTSGARLLRSSMSSISAVSRHRFYDACCVQAMQLCSLYYNIFPRPNHELYKSPNKAGLALGAGQFRSFDSQEYRFMAIGDYWLVKQDNYNVQIRMQDTNAAANNSAGITGVAFEVKGNANLTVEIHWSMESKNFSRVHYSINGGAYVNLSAPTQSEVNDQEAVLSIRNRQMFTYTWGRNSWLEVKAGNNGLSVLSLIDSEITGTTGLLGNNDNNNTNDVSSKTAVLAENQLNNQTAVDEALMTWSVATAESLFKVQTTTPTAASGWSARYWSDAWSSNETLLMQELFNGNQSHYDAAKQSCTSLNNTSVQYRNCLMEFADCSVADCSAAYIAELHSATTSITHLTCTAPKWKAATLSGEVTVTEGQQYSLNLAEAVDLAADKSEFSKLTGPANLTITGQTLNWWPAGNDLSAVAILLRNKDTNCSSVWPMRIRFKRVTGVCANSDEGFTAGAYSSDDILRSQCQCRSNYYTDNCSFGTCQLGCYSCNNMSCSSSCPTNYQQEKPNDELLCWYADECKTDSCTAPASSACRSVMPKLQTTDSKFQCTCSRGYVYEVTSTAVNKKKCVDINECNDATLNTCNSNQTCTNTAGSYKCDCKSGFQLNSDSICVDIDECSNATLNSCNANTSTCVNEIGSYSCKCKSGYSQTTSKTCTDNDECANPAVSMCQQRCTNSPGSFTCACEAGFSLAADGKSCTVDTAAVCATDNKCEQFCAKSGTTDTCYCRAGFTLKDDKTNCSAITYCTTNICGAGGTCTEANPGYNCQCAQHHRKGSDGKCAKIDYCNNATERAAVCPGGTQVDCKVNGATNAPTCVCNNGFAIVSNACSDVDECANSTLNACDQGSTICRNTIGTYACACRSGYKRINSTKCEPAPYTFNIVAKYNDLSFTTDMSDNGTVAFANMAAIIENRMVTQLPADAASSRPTVTVLSLSNGSVVANTSISYSSPDVDKPAIKSSLESAGLTAVTAADVNECLGENDCSNEHQCVDTSSGYNCQCKTGYTKIGIRSGFPATKTIDDCVDINECLTQCRGANKTCTNKPGGFSCVCSNGSYSADPLRSACEDPCKTGRCQNSGSCQYRRNSEFPYRCVCLAGFVGIHCELHDEHYWGMQRTAIIIAIILGVLLLLALLAIAFFVLKKYRADKHRADFYQSNFSESPVRQNAGTYKGTQSMQMTDTTIPRAQPTAQHPSSFENRGYERDQQQQRQRTDYF